MTWLSLRLYLGSSPLATVGRGSWRHSSMVMVCSSSQRHCSSTVKFTICEPCDLCIQQRLTYSHSHFSATVGITAFLVIATGLSRPTWAIAALPLASAIPSVLACRVFRHLKLQAIALETSSVPTLKTLDLGVELADFSAAVPLSPTLLIVP